MTCLSAEEYFGKKFWDNLTFDELRDLIGPGHGVFTAATNEALKLAPGPIGSGVRFARDVLSIAVSGAAGGSGPTGGGASNFYASSISAAAGTAAIYAGEAAVAATALGASPVIGGVGLFIESVTAAHVVGAAAGALFETMQANDGAAPGECPYPDEPDPPNPNDPSFPGDLDPSDPNDPNNPENIAPYVLGWPPTLPPTPEAPAFFLPWSSPLFPWLDPLVIDLDGGGFDLLAVDESAAMFDMNEDGFREHVGWIGGGTGLLVVDRNGNNDVDDMSELVGSLNEDGFISLAAMDDNEDGKIDSEDELFGYMKIWEDRDGDGEVDNKELNPIVSYGIASLFTNFVETTKL